MQHGANQAGPNGWIHVRGQTFRLRVLEFELTRLEFETSLQIVSLQCRN